MPAARPPEPAQVVETKPSAEKPPEPVKTSEPAPAARPHVPPPTPVVQRWNPAPGPQPQPAPPPPAAPAPEPEQGYLTLDTYPWTRVSLNGRVLGNTPLVRVALPAGTHVLTLENPQDNVKQTTTVVIKPNETVSKRLAF